MGERRVMVGPLSNLGVLALAAAVVKRSRKLLVLGAGALVLDQVPAARRLNERLQERLTRRAKAAEAAALARAEEPPE